MKYRVVNTDNYGSDYPDESFVGPFFNYLSDAQKFADSFNTDPFSSRYHKVVPEGYELQPGFEP